MSIAREEMNTNKVHQDLIGKPYSAIIDRLEIHDDQGDCCGWSKCQQTGQIPEGIDKDALTLKDCAQIDYYSESMSRTVLNFVFSAPNGDEVILGYDLSAGSGSGWSYGAYVRLSLDGKELAEASW